MVRKLAFFWLALSALCVIPAFAQAPGYSSPGGAPAYNEGAEYGLTCCTPTVALTNGADQSMTLSANATIAFTQPSGYVGRVTLFVTQAAAASYTITWTSVKWPGGVAPVMTAAHGAIDVYSCKLDGTYTYCTAVQNLQ
jgi:hypothetical protein